MDNASNIGGFQYRSRYKEEEDPNAKRLPATGPLLKSCFAVRNPPASGLYTSTPVPVARQRGHSSRSDSRCNKLYLDWDVTNRSHPRASHLSNMVAIWKAL